jgi:mRNA-degrading endonuclease RelE of RelBE toxin-antitoxin system
MGNYRIIAELREEKITVMVLRIGHRKNVYGGH